MRAKPLFTVFCYALFAFVLTLRSFANPETSHRFIVEFKTPSLADMASEEKIPLDTILASPAAGTPPIQGNGKDVVLRNKIQSYKNRIRAEKQSFLGRLKTAFPKVKTSAYTTENGFPKELDYELLFNGLTLDPGSTDPNTLLAQINLFPEIKAVYRDYAHYPTLYNAVHYLGIDNVWSLPAIGGRADGGKGIRIASMDGGIVPTLPMFLGTHFNYPADAPPKGYGETQFNNGKVIAQHAYFRSWDPPVEGEGAPFSLHVYSNHGTHTSGIMAGNIVEAFIEDATHTISGVAPGAWLMNYRVLYPSVSGVDQFFSAEGIAALEDMVRDGADVINGSWALGALTIGGEGDPIDRAAIAATKAGAVVVFSAGNVGPSSYIDHPSDAYITVAASERSTLAPYEPDDDIDRDGNTDDYVAIFSSRGPGAGNVLKPDIAAPGVYIYSQVSYRDEQDTLQSDFWSLNGTSMAAPFVSGAAALLKQLHPEWNNHEIKAAIMNTADYLGILGFGPNPAQPLDMGAGRLNINAAVDPGALVLPPSLGYGFVSGNNAISYQVTVKSVTTVPQTFSISTLYTGDGYTRLRPLDGFTVTSATVTVAPDSSSTFSVTFNPTQTPELGDKQGYIVLQSEDYHVHIPVWARVVAKPSSKILLVDNDYHPDNPELPDYRQYYTDALNELRIDYDIWSVEDHYNHTAKRIPNLTDLAAYQAVIVFTGDNFYPTLEFSDAQNIWEYVNNGGAMLMIGQNATQTISTGLIFYYYFGCAWLKNGLGGRNPNDSETLKYPVIAAAAAPPALQSIRLNFHVRNGEEGNQFLMDELAPFSLFFNNPYEPRTYREAFPLLRYTGNTAAGDGYNAIARRQYQTLEHPVQNFLGRMLWVGFGLEGINTVEGFTTRSQLLQALLNLLTDNPSITIETVSNNETTRTIQLKAAFNSNIPNAKALEYRWDFGDGSKFQEPGSRNTVTHTYDQPGQYLIRVQATDNWGTSVVGTLPVIISPVAVTDWHLY